MNIILSTKKMMRKNPENPSRKIRIDFLILKDTNRKFKNSKKNYTTTSTTTVPYP